MADTTDQVKSKEFPPIAQQAYNLLQQAIASGKSLTKDGKLIADLDLQNQRWAICKTCEDLSEQRCLKCGCIMPFKVKLEEAKCPTGKW
jgi:hypothetical protein